MNDVPATVVYYGMEANTVNNLCLTINISLNLATNNGSMMIIRISWMQLATKRYHLYIQTFTYTIFAVEGHKLRAIH